MSEKDYTIPIDHMLEAISGIDAVLAEAGDELGSSWTHQRALERGFEIISEASRRLPDALRSEETAIPWRRIAGIGNILRHEYSDVSLAVLLRIYADELPELRAALLRMRAQLTG